MAITKSANRQGHRRLTTTDMEVLVAQFLDPRINLIVPNVSWGMGIKIEITESIILNITQNSGART